MVQLDFLYYYKHFGYVNKVREGGREPWSSGYG